MFRRFGDELGLAAAQCFCEALRHVASHQRLTGLPRIRAGNSGQCFYASGGLKNGHSFPADSAPRKHGLRWSIGSRPSQDHHASLIRAAIRVRFDRRPLVRQRLPFGCFLGALLYSQALGKHLCQTALGVFVTLGSGTPAPLQRGGIIADAILGLVEMADGILAASFSQYSAL